MLCACSARLLKRGVDLLDFCSKLSSNEVEVAILLEKEDYFLQML